MARVELIKDGGIGIVRMNDPAHLNPLDIAMDDALYEALADCEADEKVKVVVLAGAGRAFSAGGDMRFFKAQIDAKAYENLDAVLVHVNRVIVFMKKMKKLIVCAVQGHAAGGGANLALAADFIIGDETFKLSEPFTKIGLAPDAGGMYLLSRAVGARRALAICTDCHALSAAEAETLGLLTRRVPVGEAEKEAVRYAKGLAGRALLALELAKKQNYEVNYKDFEEYLAVTETETLAESFRSVDFAESVNAFLEKRAPIYTGK